MLNALIFSKDRECQLDLLIRSIKQLWIDRADFKLSVLYKYSNEQYKKGYDRTINRHPDLNYIIELPGEFKKQVVSEINPERFTTFFVDDDVFKERFEFKCKEVLDLDKNEEIACLSLRLYPGINYCYTMRINTPPPKLINKNCWICKGTLGDWNYKMSVDGHIFRTKDIIKLITGLDYKNPNTFEGTLACHELNNPLMMCFEKSVIMNIPVNKVQSVNGNHCGNISAEYLNTKFLEGCVIDLDPIIGFENISAHQEIDLKLKNE